MGARNCGVVVAHGCPLAATIDNGEDDGYDGGVGDGGGDRGDNAGR